MEKNQLKGTMLDNLEKKYERIKDQKISLLELMEILESSISESNDILKSLDKSNFRLYILKKDSGGNVIGMENLGTNIADN